MGGGGGIDGDYGDYGGWLQLRVLQMFHWYNNLSGHLGMPCSARLCSIDNDGIRHDENLWELIACNWVLEEALKELHWKCDICVPDYRHESSTAEIN